MAIPDKITVPDHPRFIPAPDQKSMELYIVCCKPLALIWVRQTTPAQLYIIEGPQEPQILKDCAEWYRNFVGDSFDKN